MHKYRTASENLAVIEPTTGPITTCSHWLSSRGPRIEGENDLKRFQTSSHRERYNSAFPIFLRRLPRKHLRTTVASASVGRETDRHRHTSKYGFTRPFPFRLRRWDHLQCHLPRRDLRRPSSLAASRAPPRKLEPRQQPAHRTGSKPDLPSSDRRCRLLRRHRRSQSPQHSPGALAREWGAVQAPAWAVVPARRWAVVLAPAWAATPVKEWVAVPVRELVRGVSGGR